MFSGIGSDHEPTTRRCGSEANHALRDAPWGQDAALPADFGRKKGRLDPKARLFGAFIASLRLQNVHTHSQLSRIVGACFGAKV